MCTQGTFAALKNWRRGLITTTMVSALAVGRGIEASASQGTGKEWRTFSGPAVGACLCVPVGLFILWTTICSKRCTAHHSSRVHYVRVLLTLTCHISKYMYSAMQAMTMEPSTVRLTGR